MRKKLNYISQIIFIAGFFACTHSVNTNGGDQPAPSIEKPVSSLAGIAFLKENNPTTFLDTMRIFYDSATHNPHDIMFPYIFFTYQGTRISYLKLYTDNGFPPNTSVRTYSVNYDAGGRPISGLRTLNNKQLSRFSNSYDSDSIRYTVNNNNQLVSVDFFDRIHVLYDEAPTIKRDSTKTRGIIESCALEYDIDGNVSRIHLDQGVSKKFDIEYTYGSGKNPMTAVYMGNNYMPEMATSEDRGFPFWLALPMLQATHELLKIKTTNLATGEVATKTFLYTYRKDGYPDKAILETQASTNLSISNIVFIYNYK